MVLMAALLGVGSMVSVAQAKEPEHITYIVEPGDTLLQIARDYMISADDWPQVQTLNEVGNPRKLAIGKALRLPRALLRYNDVRLQVRYFAGQVFTDGSPVAQQEFLNPGSRVTTGANGFVTFESPEFGGRVSLPSNSAARLVVARRYILNETLFVDFEIERGRGTIFSPPLDTDDQLLLTTPRAVTAVRGTEFRVAFDPEADSSITEVTEGVVAVAALDKEISAEQGFGVRSTADGLGEPEALLPAPKLINPTAIQLDETLKFALEPNAASSARRVQIARDVTFLDVIEEQVVEGDTATFASLENRQYYVRARDISDSGIEGFFSDTAGFRRKRVGVAASNGPSEFVDGLLFKWLPEGEEDSRFAFQLWSANNRDALLIDETGLDIPAMVLTDIPAGTYQWRVAAIVPDEEGLLKVWTPAQTLTIS
ncbi:MAG: FecR domain-containing protein [Pseudomonadota bacterium]